MIVDKVVMDIIIEGVFEGVRLDLGASPEPHQRPLLAAVHSAGGEEEPKPGRGQGLEHWLLYFNQQ